MGEDKRFRTVEEGLGNHKSEKDAGPEEGATNPGEGAALVH